MPDLSSIKLSAQRALLGFVTQNMRAIYIEYTTNSILLRVCFFENPSERELEFLSVITTEILSDFNEVKSVKEEYFVDKTTYPNKLNSKGICVFMRSDGFDWGV